jgi:subtilisin family serine protease
VHLDAKSVQTTASPRAQCVRRVRGVLAQTLVIGIVLFSPFLGRLWTHAQSVLPVAGLLRNQRILVKPLPGVDLKALHAITGSQVLKVFPFIGNLHILQLAPGAVVAGVIAIYQESGLVSYAEPDFIVHARLTPNDFRYNDGSLWGLHNTGIYGGIPGADIHAPEGWELQHTAEKIIVAVIDTGIRVTHEDLAANLWRNLGESGLDAQGLDKSTNGIDDDGDGYVDDVHGINAILQSGQPVDDHGHGTHVSGTIGAVGGNTVGVVGVAWKIQIMACKFLDSQAEGSVSDAITCIDYARAKGAKIINASWGNHGFNSSALYDAINSARQAGIIFVAACGNDNTDNDANPVYPSSYDLDNIVAVAATGRTDTKASFSNYGATTVDLGAPGDPIFSCWNGSDSDYRYWSGTSMAAPHVAGACALLWARHPSNTYQQVIRRVLATADPLPSLVGKCVTGGRLNLLKALASDEIMANLIADPVAGAVPLTVHFRDPSSGIATNWLWNFGDGTTNSTQQNPTHIYNRAGNFTVTFSGTGGGMTNNIQRQVIQVSGWMAVTPAGSFSTSGNQGGPFSPGDQTYTIQNMGGAPLNWTASVDQTWATVRPGSGGLSAGQQTAVTVTINSQANALLAQNYSAAISFKNLNNGDGDTVRQVILSARGGDTNVPPILNATAIRFRLAGKPGDTNLVEASTDLRHWMAILTNRVDNNGWLEFTDPQVRLLPVRFYRAVVPPGRAGPLAAERSGGESQTGSKGCASWLLPTKE